MSDALLWISQDLDTKGYTSIMAGRCGLTVCGKRFGTGKLIALRVQHVDPEGVKQMRAMATAFSRSRQAGPDSHFSVSRVGLIEQKFIARER
jgi:hypothetical protein